MDVGGDNFPDEDVPFPARDDKALRTLPTRGSDRIALMDDPGGTGGRVPVDPRLLRDPPEEEADERPLIIAILSNNI